MQQFRHPLLIILGGAILIAVVIAFVPLSGMLDTRQPGQTPDALQRAQVTPTPLPAPAFQTGMITPQWGPTSYGPADTTWNASLPVIRQETGARFLEMPLLFSQETASSAVVSSQGTPAVANVATGIIQAERAGYQVFLVPLLAVRTGHAWAGDIQFTSITQESAWFDSYWHAYAPYVEVAAQEQVSQLAIGTELDALAARAPSFLWQRLIARIASVYIGRLTYDMNWSEVNKPLYAWELDTHLSMLGVSAYFPLENTPAELSEQTLQENWQGHVLPLLDQLAQETHKPVLISEVGYRAYTDAAYQPWNQETITHAAPSEQAQADTLAAAIVSAEGDSHIAGIYLWGWNGVGGMQIEGSEALHVIAQAYTQERKRG